MKNLTITALLIIAALFTGCATGSNVLTGTARPQFAADAVRIYATMPEKAETVGLVNSNSGRQSLALQELKNQAGKLGANGVVITGNLQSFGEGTQYSGTAIFVP